MKRILLAVLLFAMAGTAARAQLDCCDAVPLPPSGTFGAGSIDGPGAVNDDYSGTCLSDGENDAYFIIFEAYTSGTFEMVVTPNNLDADYDFALVQGGCPGNPGTQQISCSFIGPINDGVPGVPFAPTGIADDPVGTWGVTPNPDPANNEWEPTVDLVAGNIYVLILDNITNNGVGFSLQTGGSASIGPPNNLPPPPTITPAGPFCAGDPPAQLFANPPGGTWDGPFTNGSGVFNPANPGTFTVTYTSTAGICPEDATIDITVLPQPTVTINTPGPICVDAPAQTLTANPPGGTWGGVASPTGQVNPGALGPGNFPVSYTFTDANGCTNTANTTVNIVPLPQPNILDAGPFCVGQGPQQLFATPPGGTWGNAASPAGIVDPASLGVGNFAVTYTYTDPNGCTNTVFSDITITPDPVANILTTGPFCQDDPGEQLQADPPGGTWGGDVPPNGFFDPATLGPGPQLVTYAYTDPNGCMANTQTIIEVLPPPVVTINDPMVALCSSSPPIQLTADPPGGTWGGEANPDGTFDPAGRTNGSYTVTYTGTDAFGCSNTATLEIEISSDLTVSIDPAGPYCEDEPPVTLTGNPMSGTWGGDAESDGSFRPADLGVGSYTVTYDFTDAEGCSGSDTLTIDVNPLPQVSIDAAGPYCADAGSDTLSATPANGVWSGDVDAEGVFNPSVAGPGNYQAIYTFTDPGGCSDADTITLAVNANPAVSIAAAGPFCANDTIQQLSGTPAGGNWGGTANADGTFDPAALGSGLHPVSYTFTDSSGCSGFALDTLEVLELPTGSIAGGGSICQGATDTVFLPITLSGTPPFTVVYAIDGDEQPALITSMTTDEIIATVPGVYTIVSVEDANGCIVAGTGSAEVTEDGIPSVSSIATTCDGTNSNYTISFTITGGDPASYSVTGGSGTLTTAPPYVFTSDPIPNGTPYSFTVDDTNGCNPTTVDGSFSCDCATQSGSMNTTPIVACENDTATLIYNNDGTLDPNDTLLFVLHDNNGTSLGTILATNDVPEFGFVPPMSTGTTYYVSAVATDTTAGGGVDYNSSCLSVSIGTPLTFYALPTATLQSDTAICDGASALLTVTFTGTGPYDFIYNDGSTDIPVPNVNSPYTFTVSPGSTTTYRLVSATDSSPASCSNVLSDSATVTILPNVTTNQQAEICQGDSLLLAGDFQTAAGTYVDTLVAVNSCDSIVITELIVNIPDTTLLTDSSCDPTQVGVTEEILVNQQGCDSVIITNTLFLESDTTILQEASCNPLDTGTTELLLSNADGCDSLVITVTSLLPSDTTFVENASCNPQDTGTVEALLQNQFGCDSLVLTTTTLLPSDTFYIDTASCNPQDTGTVETLLQNQFGCDSLVITNTVLLPSDTTFLAAESCNPQDTGTVETLLQNQFGCDSLIVTTTTLLPSDTTFLTAESCNPQDTGTVETLLQNQFGCDSLIVTTTTLLPSDTTFLAAESCNPQDTGTVETLLQNQFGCDSLIVTTTTLLPSDTTFVENTSCDPDEVGTVETLLQNQFGCDSLIITTTTLLPSDTTTIELTTCEPDAAGTEEELLINQFGCDSLVITTTVLLPSDTTFVENASCDPNEVGTQEELLQNQFGCDSLVITTTTLLASDTTTVNRTSCDPGEVGTVTEVLSNQNGCDSLVFTVTTLVEFEVGITDVLDYGGFGVSCPGATDGSATVSVLSDVFEPPLSYQWSNGETDATATELAAGTSFVTVTSGNGCSAVDSVTLSEPEPLQISLAISPISCFDDADGQIAAEVTGGVPPYLYSIDGQAFQSLNAFAGLGAGTYSIRVQDASGCEVSAEATIDEPQGLSVELGPDISIETGGSASLDAVVNPEGSVLDTVIWQPAVDSLCPDCLQQDVRPERTTVYRIEIVDENGCTATDQVRVFVDRRQEVYFPNVFSPNDDGTNELFRPFTSDRAEEIELFEVYNRWGEPVFTASGFSPNDANIGWNGTFRGEMMNPGVFVFQAIVRFSNGDRQTFKGDVTLLR